MATRLTTGARNEVLNDGWVDAFAGGTLEIRTGNQPATPDLAPSGTLLASIALPTPCFGAAAAGAIAKAGTWNDPSANAAGAAGYARFKAAGTDDTEDDTQVRMDVDVSESGGGGQLIIDNEDIEAGQSVTVTACTITQPAS